MVPRLPRPPNDNDSRPAIRSLEELMDAPTANTPDTLLSEAGEERRRFGRELARRLMAPLPDLLREGGA